MASPPDEELTTVLINLKSTNPSLGVPKIHALLLTAHPEWTVSEKRTRKILQKEGLIETTTMMGINGSHIAIVYPSSRVVRKLDVSKWTTKVEVKYFDKKKGKGLVAKEKIDEGEVVWKEDPFVVAPESEIYDMQIASTACAFCTTPLGLLDSTRTSLITPCPASTTTSPCPSRFCNRLCLSRSSKTHPLLCPSQNPAVVPLLRWARQTDWMALQALAQCTSRILLTNESDQAALENDWEIVRGFAEIGIEQGLKYKFTGKAEPDKTAWKKAFKLYVQAFKDPPNVPEKKKLARILKKPLKPEIERELFEYDAFLRGIGKMSLNLESHGGLYTLHSHLNHSCTPNISARHLDQRTALARLTLIAKKDIEIGGELVISYVDPGMDVRARRAKLEGWGFGVCKCGRCVEEAKTYKPSETGMEMGVERGKGFEMDDLENELKAGLGVL